MARPRLRSSWTNDTITVDPLPSNVVSEEEFDNELTLTSDDILKAQKSSGFYLNFSDGFDKQNFVEERTEKEEKKEEEFSKEQPKTKLSNTCSELFQTFLLDIKRKATWTMAKQVLKAAFAYWLAFLIDLIVPIMHKVGSGTFLAIVMVCYFQPSRTFGALSESAAWGIVGAAMASLWSWLGIIISNALRHDEVYYTPSTVMNLIFLAIGTFTLSYDKIKWPPMRFGSINAIIIMSFSLTQSYIRPHTEFKILKSLLIPMIIGPTCSVIANLLLWPENATTNYIPYMHETLQSFIDLLDQETHFFLRDAYNRNTISQLHRTVQDNLQNLDNAKREAQHEISFSKIGPEDLIEINRLMKNMYMTLGGLALSGVIEEELMKDGQEGTIEIRIEDNNECESIFDHAYRFGDESPPHSPTNTIGTMGKEEDLTKLLYILRPICTELSEACQLCLADCISRVDHFQHNCCDPWYKKWWPFCRKPTPHHYQNVVEDPLQHLQLALVKFNDVRQEGLNYLFNNQETISPSPQRMFLLLLLFENNLKVFSENLGFLVGLVKVLETKRLSKRLWMPSIPFLKRIKNIGESDEDGWKVVEPQNEEEEEDDLFSSNYCDPDVTPPVTTSQKFWYQLWKIRNWFNSKYARFAFKNSLVVTCLSIPAFLPHTSEFFDNYRGQWALISAVLSFSPTTGGAVLQFLGRLIGSGVGAIMAIISWEITKGNAYGLAAILFIFSLLLWFIYLNAKVWTVGGVIMLVNFPLVLANIYQASNGLGNPTNTVFTIAAMRTSAVSTGLTASFIMKMIPWPHTGRVEIRHRLARTISNLGILYSMTVSSLLKTHKPFSLITTRPFRKLVTRINRSIATERLLLSRTIYEPPLRGYFPMEDYKMMIDIVEHLVNLINGLEYTLHGLNGTEWKTDLAGVLTPSKCHYITHILTSFHILSTALENGIPLPPYNIVASGDTKFGKVGLGSRISHKISRSASELTKLDLETQAYACYCAYLIKTSHLTNELLKLVRVVKRLVGVNRYVKELCDF